MKNAHMYRVGIASVSRRWRISPSLAVIFSGLFILLGACQSESESVTERGEGAYDAKAEAACIAEGGMYRVAGILGQHLCIKPTPDAGQSCQSETDCSGFCLADTNSCSPVTPIFGCHAILMEDGERAEICID